MERKQSGEFCAIGASLFRSSMPHEGTGRTAIGLVWHETGVKVLIKVWPWKEPRKWLMLCTGKRLGMLPYLMLEDRHCISHSDGGFQNNAAKRWNISMY